MFNELYNYELFSIAGHAFLTGPLFIFIILLLLSVLLYKVLKEKFYSGFYKTDPIKPKPRRNFFRIVLFLLLFLLFLAFIYLFDLNVELLRNNNYILTFGLVIKTLLIIQFARLLDWLLSNILIRKHKLITQDSLDKEQVQKITTSEASAAKIVSYIVYVLVLIFITRMFSVDFTLFNTTINNNSFEVKISNILRAALVILIARLIIWAITQLFLYGFYRRKNVDLGIQYAFNQLLTYVIYVIASIMALQIIGINMTLIWGGAAALLVGAGLGLQQTFNDLFSGVMLLFERTVKVNDVLEVEGVVGTVLKIGLRSSVIDSRENITFIVPNSKLTNQNVINWSHMEEAVRFQVNVGVAYGSDTKLVETLLLEALKISPDVLKHPKSFVRFIDFGNSSLNFSVLFFSKNYIIIENTKSQIRFEIDRLFRENNVTIPFPQRDVWMRDRGSA